MLAIIWIGYSSRQNSKSTRYAICVYTIVVFNILFALYCVLARLGYIDKKGNFVGYMGKLAETIIINVFEINFTFYIFYYTFVLLLVNGLLLFTLAGFANSLPNGAENTSENDHVSSFGRKTLYYTSIVYSKSLASLAAFFPATLMFVVVYDVDMASVDFSVLKVVSYFLFLFASAIAVITATDFLIGALGDTKIYFDDEKFQRFTGIRRRYTQFRNMLHRRLL